MPPASSLIVFVGDRIQATEGIVERKMQPLLDGGLGIARGNARFDNDQAQMLVTNFSEDYRQLNKGRTIAFLDELANIQSVVAISDRSVDGCPERDHTPSFDVNAALPRN